MKHNYYYRLNVPNKPLKQPKIWLDPELSVGNQIYPLSRDILSDQTIEMYASVGLDVDCCFCFLRVPHGSRPDRLEQHIVHTDHKFIGDQMLPWHFGINYELDGGPTKLSWWDVRDVEYHYPERSANNGKLYGVIAGDKDNPFNGNYTLLDSVIIDKVPTLVNTSVMHSTDLYGHETHRLGLSIRFANEVQSWEEAVELCRPLIVGDE